MLVPVAFVGGVAVTVMGVVDVALVRDRHVPASFTVCVLVGLVGGVIGGGALVDMVVVRPVQVTVVHVVDVVAVRDGGVSAALPVRVLVTSVGLVGDSGRHRVLPAVLDGRRAWHARRLHRRA